MLAPPKLRRVPIGAAGTPQSDGQDLRCATTQPVLADSLIRTDLEEGEGMAVWVLRHRTTYRQLEPAEVVTFGAFQFAGHVPVGKIADFYGLPVAQAEKATPVGNFVADRLPATPSVGDSIGIGVIGHVVHDVSGDRITRVGLEL